MFFKKNHKPTVEQGKQSDNKELVARDFIKDSAWHQRMATEEMNQKKKYADRFAQGIIPDSHISGAYVATIHVYIEYFTACYSAGYPIESALRAVYMEFFEHSLLHSHHYQLGYPFTNGGIHDNVLVQFKSPYL